MQQIKPDEVYNLAGQSFVPVSLNQPLLTMEVSGMGALRMMEAIRRYAPAAKFLQASSAEIFGKADGGPQTELTRLRPRNPYGAAKLFAHHMTINYRESYGMFACSCIAFNHESPRRGESFVSRKITRAVAAIKLGFETKLSLGNLDAKRDWGYAKDYVTAMWMMLQADKPDDYVIATGENHTVREFCEVAFSHVGLDYQKYVVVDPKYFRPTEVDVLLGDASKAKRVLGWEPTTRYAELVKIMVDADLERLKAGEHGIVDPERNP